MNKDIVNQPWHLCFARYGFLEELWNGGTLLMAGEKSAWPTLLACRVDGEQSEWRLTCQVGQTRKEGKIIMEHEQEEEEEEQLNSNSVCLGGGTGKGTEYQLFSGQVNSINYEAKWERYPLLLCSKKDPLILCFSRTCSSILKWTNLSKRPRLWWAWTRSCHAIPTPQLFSI